MPLIGPRYYAVRMVERGPRMPLKVWYGPSTDPDTGEELDRAPRWYAILRGIDTPIEEVMIEFDGDGSPVIGGDAITPEEYTYLLARREYAMNHDPSLPEAAPRSPIKLSELRPFF